MSIVKEKYSPTRVNLIYQLLQDAVEEGQPKEYDIRVDELKVVSRTADPERFHLHEDYVQPDSRNITICLYDGSSRRCTRYVLLMREEEDSNKNVLDGVEQTITEKLQQEKRQWQYEQLQKENEALQQQIAEAEEYAGELQERIQLLETEKNNSSNRITETLVSLAGVYLSKHPNALNGIPLLGDLVNTDTPQQLAGHPPAANASFKKQEPAPTGSKPPEFAGKVTVEHIEALRRALIPFFSDHYLPKVEDILNYLYRNNAYIDQLLDSAGEEEEPDVTGDDIAPGEKAQGLSENLDNGANNSIL